MSSPRPLALTVRDLTYRYRRGDLDALRNVSFSAEAGQIILIAGASGSGKTTLLRCLNGLIPHSYKGGKLSGVIRIFGQEPASLSLSELSKRVGTVLQDPEKQIVGSYVANEVAFGLENLAVPRTEMVARIDGVLDHLGILPLRNRETFYLSGGEKQKVVVAGTLVLEPSVLLLDEPLANLDPRSMAEALALIRRLADEGHTILIIEHRVEDVLKVHPDKVLFLVDGDQRYFGDASGFKSVADPREVKLSAPLIIRLMKERNLVPANGNRPPARPAIDPQKPPLVQFEEVTFWYEQNQPVLRDISLSIKAGDVIGVLGPNGAGKSTLVKHAIGLLKPEEGAVKVGGRHSRELSVAQIARTVGYVFQSPSHMLFAPTVRREMAFGPRNLDFEEDHVTVNVEAALRLVDLEEKAEEPPLALSFGQQKRVTIAAVVAMTSRVLVMDEPTAGQDYRHYMEFMDAILNPPENSPWRSAFEAVVFITHDLDLAICYANRLLLLNEGRLVADGPPHEVLRDRQLLARCRLEPTSLLELNLKLLSRTGRFMRAEYLARYAHEADLQEPAATGVGEDHGSG